MSILSKYIKTIWSNNTDPAINETNKNKVENQLETLTDQVNDNYDQGQENKNSISSLLSRLLNAIGKDSLSEVVDARNSAAKGINYTVLDDRLEAIDSEIVDSRESAVKGKTFTVLDERLEEIEQDKVNAIDNSFYADINAYYGNVKTADDGQDETLWSGGTPTLDTLNKVLGSQSVRFTTIVGTITPAINNISPSINFETLNNGEVSPTDDYIVVDFKFTTPANITSAKVRLSSDAAMAGNYVEGELLVLTSSFKQYAIKKSTLVSVGTGADLSNIQSIGYEIVATDVQNVNHQYIQLVKKDTILDYPNPFQKFGVREFSIILGEWFIGDEFGKIIFRELSANTNSAYSFVGDLKFDNFIMTGTIIPNSATLIRYFHAIKDAGSYIGCTAPSNDEINFTVRESGIILYSENISFPFNSKDKINITIIKNGTNVIFKANKNGNPETEIIRKSSTTLSQLSIGLGVTVTGIQTYESISMSELTHSYHSHICEMAKSVEFLEKNGAFIANELSVSQIGYDTANYRTYTKFPDGTLVYTQWTTV